MARRKKKKGLGFVRSNRREDGHSHNTRPSFDSVAIAENAQSFKTYVGYGVLGVGTATGLFFLVRHLIRNTKAKSSEKKSTTEGNPATYAKLLKMAFENDNWAGWGTDEDLVFQVMREIPSQSLYAKVQREYSNQNSGAILNADLASELSSSDYQKVVEIINQKPR